MTNQKIVGSQLRLARFIIRQSLRQMEGTTGLNYQTINHLEHGRQSPTIVQLDTLQAAYGFRLDDPDFVQAHEAVARLRERLDDA